MTIASFISTVAFYFVRYSLYFNIGGDRRREGRNFVLVWLVSIAVWIISFLLVRALSRYREYSAGRGSAIITGHPWDLASALMRISGLMDKVPDEDLRQMEGMNFFLIIPAISGSSIRNLFFTHPSVEKRTEKLEHMQRELY